MTGPYRVQRIVARFDADNLAYARDSAELFIRLQSDLLSWLERGDRSAVDSPVYVFEPIDTRDLLAAFEIGSYLTYSLIEKRREGTTVATVVQSQRKSRLEVEALFLIREEILTRAVPPTESDPF